MVRRDGPWGPGVPGVWLPVVVGVLGALVVGAGVLVSVVEAG